MPGGGSGDGLAMRLHDLKRELIRGYVEGKQAPASAGPKISISREVPVHAGRVFLAVHCATALGCRYWFENLQLSPSFQKGKANEHFPASGRAGFGGISQFANPSTSN